MATFTQHRAAALVCGAIFAVSVGTLAACTPKQQDQASDVTSSAVSDASAMMSDAGAAVSDAVTPDSPQDFVTKAAVAGLFEIKTSELAIKTSKNVNVIAFARKMVADHTKAAAKLKAIVAKDKTLTAPEKLNDDLQKKYDDLATKTGDDFDKAYIDAQKSAHSDAVSLFDNYSKNGTDAALKTFATDTLPTLQTHKDMIDKM